MTELILAIVGSGVLTTVITLFVTRRNRKSEQEKLEADAAGAISEAWSRLMVPLENRVKLMECDLLGKQDEIDKLKKRLDVTEKELAARNTEIQELKRRIVELEAGGLEKDRTILAQAGRIQDLENEVTVLRKQLDDLGQNPRTK